MKDTIQNYSKLEKVKTTALEQLRAHGFADKITDEQLNNVVFMLSIVGDELRQLKNEKERLDLMLNRLIVLWAILIANHDIDIKKLI